MHEIVLIDGCQDDEPGKVLYGVLTHMGAIVGIIHTDKTAGGLDLDGYAIARGLVRQSYDDVRKQVDAQALVGNIVKDPFVKRQNPNAKIVVLVPESFYANHDGKDLTYVHGGRFSFKGRDIVVMSTNKFYDKKGKFDPMHFGYIMTHELGHLFGAVSNSRRTNTEENLGTHCTNDCVMRQEDGHSRETAHSFGRVGKTFCNQCKTEMRNLHRVR